MIDTMRNFLEENQAEMIALLEKVVNINSHSPNREGVSAVADVLEDVIKEMGFTTKRLSNEFTGDNLVAENAARLENGGGAMLVGHMDTVFPEEMGFNTFRQDGDTLYGPGTADMKGGLIIGIYAVKALAAAGVAMPIGFFFNADEEIGSPHSRQPIVDEAEKSDFCFVMEGSGMGGEVVTGRKGRIVFRLDVEGKAGHAGHAPFPKPSATVELAHKMVALEALNNPDEGTSLNVGVIEGGVGPNTIAAKASAQIETRFVTPENRDKVWSAIQDIAANSTVDGTSGSVEILVSRPPMVTSDAIMKLFGVVESAAGEIGVDVESVFRGGGSDANVIAEANIPVLDGMGPSGAKIHTKDEYMLTESLVRQALLTAVSMIKAHAQYA